MKTVAGKVVSSQTISLSKAAKYLERFAASDNEASPAFAAYLRRTTSAFNQLAQLHKKYKIPPDQVNAKEDYSEGVVTQGTSEVRKPEGRVSDGSLAGSSIHKASKKRKDEVDERHFAGSFQINNNMDSSIRNTNRNAADVSGDGKKSKKNSRLDNENVVDQPDGDPGAINVVEVKSEIGSLDGSEDLKKEKKNKRDKHKTQNIDAVLQSRKEVQGPDGVGDVADTVQNNGDTPNKHKNKSKAREEQEIGGISRAEKKDNGRRDNHEKEISDVALIGMQQADGVGHVAGTLQNSGDTPKKHKKKSVIREDDGNIKNEVKEELEHSSMRSAEQRGDVNAGNIDEVSDKKKHKKKRSHEPEERETGPEIETQAAEKKASKKRKYEKVADGGLDASPEGVRSKKKKDKH